MNTQKNPLQNFLEKLVRFLQIILKILNLFIPQSPPPANDTAAGGSSAGNPASGSSMPESVPTTKNRTMLQAFEWYLPDDGSHWKTLQKQAAALGKNGINMVWLPPAYKGQGGIYDVGYGVYDTYDLGEFDQKGTVRTKYGTKAEYLAAIAAFHKAGMEVLCDIVLNHRMGADYPEDVRAYAYYADNRKCAVTDSQGNPRLTTIKAWTGFDFAGRNNVHSSFKWNASHFTGVDYDANSSDNNNKVYLFEGKHWDDDVDGENGNYDYLMGVDLDLDNEEVFQELVNFGKWYIRQTDLDGFRLDAVKHMCAPFYQKWVSEMRKPIEIAPGKVIQKELFTVGEYWSSDLGKLQKYIHDTQGAFSLFDVPLHMQFYEISNANGQFDMSRLFQNTLVGTDSWHAVTFVDNHDTQPGQALGTFVNRWFKEIAYAIILLQERGVPCVFYGDYYGIPHDNVKPVDHIQELICLRQTHAYGIEHDYYDHADIAGFTREGTNHKNGLALICSDGPGGTKWMQAGDFHKGQTYVDALGYCSQKVTINQDGWGEFPVNGGAVSVWVPQV